MAYSPDSYGLGHIRRSTSVARSVLQRIPGSSVLLLTGAPRTHYFDYPEGCDYLKLPSITKDDRGRYISRDLDLSLDDALKLRSRLIRLATESFDSDLLLVDHSPRGLCGEIVPTLRALAGKTVRVLGMRDVIDDPERVREAWARDGTIEILRECYDWILIYGQRDVFDPIQAYGIPGDIARKTTFVGYVPRNGRHVSPESLRATYAPRTGRLVAVTLGGGGDGNVLLRSFLAGFEKLGADAPFEAVAVTGPLMSPNKRKRFAEWTRGMTGLSLVEFTDTLPDLLESADFVVSMGGYNTVCEMACAGVRALIVPRTFPRKEQLVRARLLAQRGVVQYLEDPTSPTLLMNHILDGLERETPARGWNLQFSALQRSVDIFEKLTNPQKKSARGRSTERTIPRSAERRREAR